MNQALSILLVALQILSCQPNNHQDVAAKMYSPQPQVAPEKPYPPLDTTLVGEYYHFVLHDIALPLDTVKDRLIACNDMARQIVDFCGAKSKVATPIACHLYATSEQKGLTLNNDRQAHADFSNRTAHIVYNRFYQKNWTGVENQLLIRDLLGNSPLKALEKGLSVYFTQDWQKRGFRYWGAQLHRSGNAPTLQELLDNDFFSSDSELIMSCMSGIWVDFLIEFLEKEAFLELYRTGILPAEMDQHWARYLDVLVLQFPPIKLKSTVPDFSMGFNFAHEGYAIHDGYGSHKAAQSLQRQAEMGANALAVVPYSFMRNANKPSPVPVVTRAGTETDEGVIQDILYARQLGMTGMLKPQIWLGRSWPGDVAMENEADWQAFFTYYHRWIRHYALLAEIHEVEFFCVGVEFAKATLNREADWRQLIQRIRGLYSGNLTYAANWGEEFEKMAFWDELDYIGLNCYYPLSSSETPGDGELKLAFAKVLEKAKKISDQFNKPLLFTEIGYTSTATPWITPHKDRTGAPYDGEAQKRCYAIVMEALQAEKDWCKGIFWWKFPSYLTYGGEGQTGFTPNGKPAENEIARWFQLYKVQ